MAKSKRNRNRNRNRPTTPHASGARTTARRLIDLPPPIAYSDPIHLSLCPDPPEPPPPPNDDDEPAHSGPQRESRANAAKHYLRSKILFSADMIETIERLFLAYAIKFLPVGALEEFLVRELARCQAQDEKCFNKSIVDEVRAVQRVHTSWDLDRAGACERLGRKLHQSPQVVAGTLARSRHCAIYMIKQWSLIEEAILSNGGLDEEQRSICLDLLGIDLVYRNGCRQVPAGDDAAGLRALVAREIARHRTNLERTLNDTDAAERSMAMLGIVSVRDSASKLLRADQNRIRRRWNWAMDTLTQLRQGADPATLIDPDTGKPVAPGPRPTAVAEPARPVPPPPPGPPDEPPVTESVVTPPMPPLSAGISDELKEALLVAAGVALGNRAKPAADEAGPPLKA